MAAINKAIILRQILEIRRQRRQKQLRINHLIASRRKKITQLCLSMLSLMLIKPKKFRIRTCRRLDRTISWRHWWNNIWSTYSEKRFKNTFRISRNIFSTILAKIRHNLEKSARTEEPISPECRLAICLYRLARGDYYYTLSEMSGLGIATIQGIVIEVCEAIVSNVWDSAVTAHFPSSQEHVKEKIMDMEEIWQFPCCWAAVDGCHISIKCPDGGAEAAKEYHNFKNFYSIVLMGLVDAKYRFVWASVGFPGNTHDAMILQATQLWKDIHENNIIPLISKEIGKVEVCPLVVADSAFPFTSWIMKPYTCAVLTPEQRYFNYRLSRARMVTECAYGQLKGRFRVLFRKCECNEQTMKTVTLACIVLHNTCIEYNEPFPQQLDIATDVTTLERRDRETVRDLLNMRSCEKVKDTSVQAGKIREALKEKLWKEKQGHGVC